MESFFEKHETIIAILLIIIYIISNSFCMQFYGLTDYRLPLVILSLTIIIVAFIIKNKLINYFGFKKVSNVKKYLYFIPLLLIMSVNLWTGININNTFKEIIFYILTMLLVGFLEEIIFRGFLYKMMAKDNIKSAEIVTSITFGIGHIINLLNGAEFIPTLLQICYAISIGYLFVTILRVCDSLWPCIITHSIVNALSIFNNNDSFVSAYIAPAFLIIIPILYTIYLRKKLEISKGENV